MLLPQEWGTTWDWQTLAQLSLATKNGFFSHNSQVPSVGAYFSRLLIHTVSKHVENAGVNSGNATLVLPPFSIVLSCMLRNASSRSTATQWQHHHWSHLAQKQWQLLVLNRLWLVCPHQCLWTLIPQHEKRALSYPWFCNLKSVKWYSA